MIYSPNIPHTDTLAEGMSILQINILKYTGKIIISTVTKIPNIKEKSSEPYTYSI